VQGAEVGEFGHSVPRFSADARDYAERVNARLVLIDSPEVAALMIEHDCGVIIEESFVRSIEIGYKSAWLLHFAAALSIRLVEKR
jgi:hypothetical protein